MEKKTPDWLQNLEVGKYSLTFLSEYTGKSKQTLVFTLKRLGLKKEYIKSSRKTDAKAYNCMEVLYIWEGVPN